MFAQLLMASIELEESFIKFLNPILFRSGYEVKIIPILKAVEDKNPSMLTGDLSSTVDLTLVTSGLLWMHFTDLPVDRTLFSNTIVITLNPDLQHSWALKPVIVLWRLDEALENNLKMAIEDIKSKPHKIPEWAGSYKETTYGWLLRDADEEPFALGAWQKLKEYILPGYKFTTWSIYGNVYRDEFKIIRIDENDVVIESSVVKGFKTIHQKKFLEIAKGWKEYKKGNIPELFFLKKTELFFYISGILHWLDLDGKLKGIPDY